MWVVIEIVRRDLKGLGDKRRRIRRDQTGTFILTGKSALQNDIALLSNLVRIL
jgi:hypothetical protein